MLPGTVQGVMAVAAPWVYTFNSTEVAGSAAQTSLVQQSRMQSFEGTPASLTQACTPVNAVHVHRAVQLLGQHLSITRCTRSCY